MNVLFLLIILASGCFGCFDWDVRLVEGQDNAEGIVEVCIDGSWGAVCEDILWDDRAALVVCRQLNFTNGTAASFSADSQSILLSEVECIGNETRLDDCLAQLMPHNCTSTDNAAGVRCTPRNDYHNGDIRLAGGRNESEGRVEIYLDGVWGTVCNNSWGVLDANVVCRQLGFTAAGARTFGFGEGSGVIQLGGLTCLGNETKLIDCSATGITAECNHFYDAGVICLTYSVLPCNHGEVRLVGGCHNLEGYVEICIHGEWGTVCDEGSWDDDDAQVVCRQLGHSGIGSRGFGAGVYGRGTGPILLDNVRCLGSEETLLGCSGVRVPEDIRCIHYQDAGVACNQAGCSEGDVRIEEGNFFNEGRVEVCLRGVWGTVCEDHWGPEDAAVVCRQLGFPTEGASIYPMAEFDLDCGPIFLDDVECSNTERRLIDCDSFPFGNCSHLHDAGVRCAWTNVPFLPFGPEVGDLSASCEQLTTLGPFELEVPVIYYLKKEYQVNVSTTGELVFPNTAITPNAPSIRALWEISFPDTILHARVTKNQSTLEMIRELLAESNEEARNFHPTLAFVATWHNNAPRKGTAQIILSTNGRISYANILFSDGQQQSIRDFAGRELLIFEAGDNLRHSSLENFDIQEQRHILNSFRVDGHCTTFNMPSRACELDSYASNCHFSLVQSSCRCFQTTEPAELHQCEATGISCVSGSVASPCIPPGALDTRYSGCYPTLLPCNNCLNENCNNEGTLYGEGAGDAILPPDKEGLSSTLTVPVIYYGSAQEIFYVSTNGIVSFGGAISSSSLCHFPCTLRPVIAPFWADLNFSYAGRAYYRTTTDQHVLSEVVHMMTAKNPTLSRYQPSLALVATWFDAMLRDDEDIQTLDTVQLIVSTDGQRSFAALLYSNPDLILQRIDGSGVDVTTAIGFDKGDRASAENFGLYRLRNATLDGVNLFRIDGLCITSVVPGEMCNLESHAIECEDFRATDCRCMDGYKHNGTACIDIDECETAQCDENSDCTNTKGSFECICKPGFTGNGHIDCNDIDECQEEICGDFGQCLNTFGNYTCTCNQGYELIGQNTCAGQASGNSVTGSAVAGVVIAVLVVVLITSVVGYLVWRRRKLKKKLEYDRNLQRSMNENEYFDRMRQMSVQSDFDLNFAKSMIVNSCNLQLGMTIGQGEFGIVYKGLLKMSFNQAFTETVAVKTLKGFLQKELVTNLLKECQKMKGFDHPNILPLKGVCLDGGPAPYIIMPFMTNGSLLNYLKEHRKALVLETSRKSLSMEDAVQCQKKLLDMCIQVAKGMEYLASKRLIHRDLAARNCMIDSGFVIKVADFGLSESIDMTKEYFRQGGDETVKLPIKWLAIESITDSIFSEKTDVWAYGVTCWEVFSGGRTPYPGIHPLDLLKQLDTGYRLEKPNNAACTDDVYRIVSSCWAQEPKDRPHFSDLVASYSTSLSAMAEYFDLAESTGCNLGFLEKV